MKEFGRTKRGWLGVEITNVTEEIAESLGLPDTKGAFVSNLSPNGPSKEAGIQAGDVILKFNNNEVNRMLDLPRLVADSEINSFASVELWRKNKILTIEVKLGELPEKSYAKGKTSSENSEEIILFDLGISIKPTGNNKGVLVTKKDDNINLLLGDIILEVNREEITTIDSFTELINKIIKTGRTSLLLKISRDNKTLWETIKFKN